MAQQAHRGVLERLRLRNLTRLPALGRRVKYITVRHDQAPYAIPSNRTGRPEPAVIDAGLASKILDSARGHILELPIGSNCRQVDVRYLLGVAWLRWSAAHGTKLLEEGVRRRSGQRQRLEVDADGNDRSTGYRTALGTNTTGGHAPALAFGAGPEPLRRYASFKIFSPRPRPGRGRGRSRPRPA